MLLAIQFPAFSRKAKRCFRAMAFTAFLAVFFAPTTLATAAPSIVVDVRSGKVISEHQAFDRWYPASLTKLMTVYTVFREIRKGTIGLNSPVKVSANALNEAPSKMGFPVGTVMTMDMAIKILMVKSANDIATATAESTAGSEAAFIALMNENAKRLGMNDSHFVNAHGLHDARQYTSAHDMAILAVAIRKEYPQYSGYFAIPALKAGKRRLSNHNPLLFRFDGTTGMKTGFTCASGLNLVASAKRGIRELVAVVLGGPTSQERNVRAAKLLSEGFSKNLFFVKKTMDELRPGPDTNRRAIDLNEIVCSRKSRDAKLAAANSVFALQPVSMDDLEKKYLKPMGPITKVEPVVLGHASGPDPFGLLDEKGEPAVAFIEEVKNDAKWPVVFGTKRVKVPVPEPNPRRRTGQDGS